MAVALAWRVAIKLAPIAGAATIRIIKWAEGPGLPKGLDWAERLVNPSESDATLSSDLTAARGYATDVATYTGEFEVRRIQMNFTSSSATLLDEDVRVCTFHLIKLASGSPTDAWVAGDFTAATGLLETFWGSVNAYYPNTTKLTDMKFYREGPSIVPPQPPVYEWPGADIPGDLSGTLGMPPQVAVSITEKTSIRKSWGRVYLPAPTATAGDAIGRINDTYCGIVADAADVLYQGLKAANLPVVVYRKALPEREEADGTVLAARAASALSVDQIQVDNLFDVIRSRRYDKPSLRVQRDIT